MTIQRQLGGWLPHFHHFITTDDSCLVDADEEEVQLIGKVQLAAGSGSKTFGTSGSAIGWLPGTSITFADNGANDPTLTVGVKKASQISTTAGPPARATIGAAAFDVYKALVGGTDTITSTTWREDAMASGTPFTVTHGDLIAICFHLDKPGAAAQSVKIRGQTGSSTYGGPSANFPVATLVTSGPTYTRVTNYLFNCVLKFDDSTLGWIAPSQAFSSVSAATTVGNTNILGNIIRLSSPRLVSEVAVLLNTSSSDSFDLGFWSDPFGTPTAVSGGTVSIDGNTLGTTAAHRIVVPLPTEITLSANTDYLLGVKQNSATAVQMFYYEADDTAYLAMAGLDANTRAAKSTAGAAAAEEGVGSRRYFIQFREAGGDDATGSGGGMLQANMRGNMQL